jgi:hypothetical protein
LLAINQAGPELNDAELEKFLKDNYSQKKS